MSRERYVLAIDHGTSGIKAALVSETGAAIDFHFVPCATRFLGKGGAEQDPEEWWTALVAAARALVGRATIPVEDIRAVSVSSTFSTTVALGREGRHLGPALTWMDSRGARHVEQAVGGFPSVMGYQAGKALRWLRRTAGAPSLSGKDDAAHVLLWKREFPAVYDATATFLPSKDYLNYRLTGEIAASYDSMQLFWATDTRDLSRIHYDDSLLAQLGIDREKLPRLAASPDVLGTLRPESAVALGLRDDVRVVLGSPDHQCAMIGSGAVRDFEPHLYVGTSSWLECPVPFMRTDPLHAIASFPTALPDRYQCVNEQDLAGGALTFLLDNVLLRRNELFSAAVPAEPYAELQAIAGRVPPGSRGAIFTPWLNGERTPVDDRHVRGGFYNLSTLTTLDDMIRAVLEGVAFNTRWMLEHTEKFTRCRLDPIRIVGGGARSDLWCQIFADVLDRRIHRVVDPVQANARGAAFIAGVGLGWLTFSDVPQRVAIDRSFTPDQGNRLIYDELFTAFRGLYRRTKSLYRQLNRG